VLLGSVFEVHHGHIQWIILPALERIEDSDALVTADDAVPPVADVDYERLDQSHAAKVIA
jgi:hypothetical protein